MYLLIVIQQSRFVEARIMTPYFIYTKMRLPQKNGDTKGHNCTLPSRSKWLRKTLSSYRSLVTKHLLACKFAVEWEAYV
jgi:hypothetical protein